MSFFNVQSIKCEISLIKMLSRLKNFFFINIWTRIEAVIVLKRAFIVTSYKFYVQEDYMTKNVLFTLRQIRTNGNF